MFGIEMREVGMSNFDYFAVDFSCDGSFSMGGKKFMLGEFTRDIANLSKDYVTGLLMLSGELNLTRRKLYFAGQYNRELFLKAREQIHAILDYVRDVKPFCFFDIKFSEETVDRFLNDAILDEYDLLVSGAIPPTEQERLSKLMKNIEHVHEFIVVYCYFGVDVANYGTAVISYTETFMQTGSRTKTDLATYAAFFFSDEKTLEILMKANPSVDMEGVTLRPRVTQVPVIGFDEEKEAPFITRRQYYGRLMDFFITELFEAMMQGHYLWRCKVCGTYFLMTTAHRQFYCGQFNPEYGTTCDHVANNRRLGRDKGMPKQKRKDGPLWVIRNQRYNSIRKNKSIGKYDEVISDMAKQILDERFEQAEIDPEYAERHYMDDIQLDKIYAEAAKRLGKQ